MANEGFKGSTILIDKLTVSAGPGRSPVLGCSVQFAAEDGTIHAVAQHSFLLDPDVSPDDLVPVVADLMQRVTKRLEDIHFQQPRDRQNPVLQGIAETLRAMPRSPDEPGTQG